MYTFPCTEHKLSITFTVVCLHGNILCPLLLSSRASSKPKHRKNKDLAIGDLVGLGKVSRVAFSKYVSLFHRDIIFFQKLTVSFFSICDQIWENPPYWINAQFVQCMFSVPQVKNCQSPDFVISMLPSSMEASHD